MKRYAMLLTLVLLCAAAPAYAGSFGVYGTYWDEGDVDPVYGAGARIGFNFLKWLELEFHGTWYQDAEVEDPSMTFDVSTIPIDGGLKFNLLPEGKFNFYVGAGFTYYLMDSDFGEVDDETGYYGDAGIEFGGDNTKFFIEAIWRDLDTTVDDPGGDIHVDFSGIAANAGLNWRW